jgi:hypothetical protein
MDEILLTSSDLTPVTSFLNVRKYKILMEYRVVGTQLFHADGRTDGQTRRSQWSLLSILRTRLKTQQYLYQVK